jgi:hypothetical protein
MLLLSAAASATTIKEEHVTGGVLDLVWVNGYDTSNNMQPLTLTAADPAFLNPSGDHTVGVAINALPDSGGIIETLTDPLGHSDYLWEAYVFTGAGNSRRGLNVRATPENNFKSFYQFVIQSGMSQLAFRKLINGTPTTLQSWFTFSLPGGAPAQNTWHKLGVLAEGNTFRCFWDGFEITATPIVDGEIPAGWVGCYNFNFSTGGIPVYFDDLILSPWGATPAAPSSWGRVKSLYVK